MICQKRSRKYCRIKGFQICCIFFSVFIRNILQGITHLMNNISLVLCLRKYCRIASLIPISLSAQLIRVSFIYSVYGFLFLAIVKGLLMIIIFYHRRPFITSFTEEVSYAPKYKHTPCLSHFTNWMCVFSS